MTHPITIVYTRSGMCLTTAEYADRREVQDAFEDYTASLGPLEVDDVIAFLSDDFGNDAPFTEWDVRGVADRAGAYCWAAAVDLPAGPGARLGSTKGDSLRLAVDGLQFPDHPDPRRRDSWYFVEGEATVGGRAWSFRWQSLTCDKAPLLTAWLHQLEAWVVHPGRAEAPTPPWLIEPNLQFSVVRLVNGRAEITVELSHEFHPLTPDPASRRPERLRIHATAEELQQAAIDLAVTIDRHSALPAASRPIWTAD